MRIIIVFTISLFVSFSLIGQRSGKDYAFLFYNTHFENGWSPLQETEREMMEVKKELADEFNFEVESFPNLTLFELSEQLKEINSRPFSENDQVLFYFSSHGVYKEGGDDGYFIPINGRMPEGDKFGETWLSYDRLKAFLGENSTKHMLVFLDACHSGAFGRRTKSSPEKFPWDQKSDCKDMTKNLLKYKSRIYFSSGNKNERSPANSILVSRFLECLRDQPIKNRFVFTDADLLFYLNIAGPVNPENGSFAGHKSGGRFAFVHKDACPEQQEKIDQEDENHFLLLKRHQFVPEIVQVHLEDYPQCKHTPEIMRRVEPGKTGRAPLMEDNNFSHDMISVSGDTFLFGDSFGEGTADEAPFSGHQVHPFMLGRYEVTFEEFDRFTDATNTQRLKDDFGRGSQPVINVSWYQAISYCNWLSVQYGFTPVYYLERPDREVGWKKTSYSMIPSIYDMVLLSPEADGFRLPTEAEWEYAASLGEAEKRRFGDGNNRAMSDRINFDASGKYATGYSDVGIMRSHTVEVGSLDAPNFLGFHEMSGNVWEWCWDDYQDRDQTNIDGEEPALKIDPYKQKKVLKGGSWEDDAFGCRAARRNKAGPKVTANVIGFRIAKSIH